MITTAISLVGAGLCLSLGFWAGKKISNQLDFAGYIIADKVKRTLKKEKRHDTEEQKEEAR